MTYFTLKLFGGLEARGENGQLIVFPRKRAEALLAYLALQHGQARPRDELAALFWGDSNSERARHSLRQVLVSLRQALGRTPRAALVESGDSVALDPRAISVDASEFETLLADGAPEALARAADLYGGELLAGVSMDDTAFGAWLRARRAYMHEQAIKALSRLLEHQRAYGNDEESIAIALRLLAMDRTQEPVHRLLMRLYAKQGRRGAALRQYQACLAALEQELGVPPEDETRLLYRELLRTNAAHASRGPQPVAPRTPLLGRDEELAQLRAALDETARRLGSCAVILGNGGIGKSRLVEALVEDAERAGALVLLGRAWEAERNLPYGPWVHAFRSSGVLRELAAGLDAPSRRELAQLFPELGVSSGDAPAEDHLPLFEAMAKALEFLSQRGRLLVIVEDLHWADEMSTRLFAFLSRAAAGWPVLLLATARPGEIRNAPAAERAIAGIARQVILAPVSRNDIFAIVAALARAGTPENAIRRLGERAWRAGKGNPFFAIETVRSARDFGADGAPDSPLPADVVAGRLDRLTGIAAQLAATAAVIGRGFDLALLARAAELEPAEAAEGVSELVERGLLHAVGEHLDFVHDHVREAAYTRLAGLHRKMLHGAVARAIEEVHASDLAPHYPALGRHCYESERWERAFRYLHAAGLDAAARSAHRDAVADFKQALAAAAHLSRDPDRVRTMIEVQFSLRGSLTLLGDHRGTLECLRATEPLARDLGDPVLQSWACIFTGNCFTIMGRHAEAIEQGEQVHALAVQNADADPEAYWSANVLGTSRFFMGDYRQSQALLRPAAVAAATADEFRYRKRGVIGHPAVVSHMFLGMGLAETGDCDEALAHAERALVLAERLASAWDTVRACLALGAVRLARGETREGIAILRHGIDRARRHDLPMGMRVLAPLLGAGLARAGEPAAALELIAPVVAAPILPYCLNYVAETYVLAGKPEEAAGVAARVLAQSTENREQGVRARALWLLGQVAATRAKPEHAAAIEHYRRALALAEEREMRPLSALCELGIAESHAAGAAELRTTGRS